MNERRWIGWVSVSVISVAALGGGLLLPIATKQDQLADDLRGGWRSARVDVETIGETVSLDRLDDGLLVLTDVGYGNCCDAALDLRTSADGRRWSLVGTEELDGKFFTGAEQIVSFKGQYVAAGSWSELVGEGNQSRVTDPVPAFWTSRDFRVWTRATLDDVEFGDAFTIAELRDSLVAVGYRYDTSDPEKRPQTLAAWTSEDGRAWTANTTGSHLPPIDSNPSVAEHDGRVVVFGRVGRQVTVASSADGERWSTSQLGRLQHDASPADSVIPFADGEDLVELVTYDYGTYPSTKSDTETWRLHGHEWRSCVATFGGAEGLVQINDVTELDSTLIAVGRLGGRAALWTSSDGCRWNPVPTPPPVRGADMLHAVVTADEGLVLIATTPTGEISNKGPVSRVTAWTWRP